MSPIFNPAPSKSAQRYEALLAAEGYYSENFSRSSAAFANLMIAGSIYFQSIGLLAGDIVTNINTVVQTAGATLGMVKFGLYTKAGVQLGVTADVKADFTAVGPKIEPLTAAYTVLTTDAYYAAMFCLSGTPLPQLMRGAPQNNGFGVFAGAGISPSGIQTGQTDLTTPATIATAAPAAAIAWWVGVS